MKMQCFTFTNVVYNSIPQFFFSAGQGMVEKDFCSTILMEFKFQTVSDGDLKAYKVGIGCQLET